MSTSDHSSVNLTEHLLEYLSPYSSWRLRKHQHGIYIIDIYSLLFGLMPQAKLHLRFEASEAAPGQMNLYTHFHHTANYKVAGGFGYLLSYLIAVILLVLVGPAAVLILFIVVMASIADYLAIDQRKKDVNQLLRKITENGNINLSKDVSFESIHSSPSRS